MSRLDLISDHSKEKLIEVPDKILDMTNLKMLFLEGNFLARLPENIFVKLPKLMWLDLRNNLLESIPKSIAHHETLENLLLTNNNIKKLPNELGLVPNLKALQVSDNPLIYPVRRVVAEGTRAIKNYLKQEYERLIALTRSVEKEEDNTLTEEQIISTIDDTSSEEQIQEKYTYMKREKKKIVPKEIHERAQKAVADPYALQPTLHVQKLSQPNIKKRSQEPVKFIHKVSRNGSKISLKSCFNTVGVRNMGKVADSNLREGWLNQLRILLTDQERILQQERNLRALSDWRSRKRSDAPKTFYDKDNPLPEQVVPFATYSEYSKMPTRQELASQLNDFFKERGVSQAGLEKGHKLNIEKLINDLVQQLKEMENTYTATRSPRSEMEQAGKQIKTIMDIHKKLLRLKCTNDSSL